MVLDPLWSQEDDVSDCFLLISIFAFSIFYSRLREILAVVGSGLDENQGLIQSKGPVQLQDIFSG